MVTKTANNKQTKKKSTSDKVVDKSCTDIGGPLSDKVVVKKKKSKKDTGDIGDIPPPPSSTPPLSMSPTVPPPSSTPPLSMSPTVPPPSPPPPPSSTPPLSMSPTTLPTPSAKVDVKKKKSKKDQDPNKPNKPKKTASSFIRFSISERKKVSESCKDVPSKEINSVVTKKLSEMWKAMSEKEKKPFVDAAAKENDNYKKAIEEYNKKYKVPKRQSSNFFMFTSKHRKEYLSKVEHIGSKQKQNTEISKLLGNVWKNMTKEEQEPYTVLAKADKVRYDNEMVLYRQKNPLPRD